MFSQPIAVYEPMSKEKKAAIQKRVEARNIISDDEIVMSIGRIADAFGEDVKALHAAITVPGEKS